MQQNKLEPGAVHRLTSKPVTTTQLVKYAGASGDFNRIHFDEPFAREKGLPGVLVHGMLTMAIVGRCVDDMAAGRARVAEFSSQFLAPVYVGDAVAAAATVVQSDSPGHVRLEVVATVGEKTVLKGKALLELEPAGA